MGRGVRLSVYKDKNMTVEELNGWLMANYNLKEKRDGYSSYSRGYKTVQVWDDGNVRVRFISTLEITENMTNIKMFNRLLNRVYYNALKSNSVNIYFL